MKHHDRSRILQDDLPSLLERPSWRHVLDEGYKASVGRALSRACWNRGLAVAPMARVPALREIACPSAIGKHMPETINAEASDYDTNTVAIVLA
jgi:hypothetical protein